MSNTIDVEGHRFTTLGAAVITLSDRNTGATYKFQTWDGTCWKLGARADRQREVRKDTAIYKLIRERAQAYYEEQNR